MYSQSYGFFSSHVCMWELDHKECWALKNWCFQTVALGRRLLRVPCAARRSNQSILKERTDAEVPIFWPPDAKSQLTGKDPDAGNDWGQEEKRVTEGEMVGWHHWLNGPEFEQTLGDREGQGSLACCSPWGHKESDTTQQLKNKYLLCLDTGLNEHTVWRNQAWSLRPSQFLQSKRENRC